MEGIKYLRSGGEEKMTDSKKVIEIITTIGKKIEEQKEYLTKLDQPIGDSDHGINMARGEHRQRTKYIHKLLELLVCILSACKSDFTYYMCNL